MIFYLDRQQLFPHGKNKELNAIYSSWQLYIVDQQSKQYNIWEECCEVDHLDIER